MQITALFLSSLCSSCDRFLSITRTRRAFTLLYQINTFKLHIFFSIKCFSITLVSREPRRVRHESLRCQKREKERDQEYFPNGLAEDVCRAQLVTSISDSNYFSALSYPSLSLSPLFTETSSRVRGSLIEKRRVDDAHDILVPFTHRARCKSQIVVRHPGGITGYHRVSGRR